MNVLRETFELRTVGLKTGMSRMSRVAKESSPGGLRHVRPDELHVGGCKGELPSAKACTSPLPHSERAQAAPPRAQTKNHQPQAEALFDKQAADGEGAAARIRVRV